MPARRRAPRRKRARKARGRKARLYSGMRGGALKTYTYNFKLLPQYLGSTGVGAVNIVQALGGTGQYPILAAGTTIPGVTNQSTTNPLAGSQSIDVGLGCCHTLNDIANSAAFASMYDAYKINYVKVEFQYLNNTSPVTGLAVMPTVWTYWDQDDCIPPVVATNVTGKMGSKCFRPTATKNHFSFKYRPNLRNMTQGAISAGSSAQALVAPATWINCTETTVPHYAMKAWISDFFTGTSGLVNNGFRINFTYNVSFRAPLLTT